MQLVLVESPTKSKSLQGFLGKNYKVLASFGHVRDLPKSKLGIDVENDFQPEYLIIPKARKIIKELKASAAKAEVVILATDPDREGESIAWHLAQALNLIPDQNKKDSKKVKTKPYQRIVFHEITKSAIKEAIKNPKGINMDLVDAQQARRILDRIVGYKLSPFLWKKITRRLSAGRVQSVAVRLVAEREKEIEDFIPQGYWTIEALLKQIKATNKNQEFIAILVKKDGKAIGKLDIKTKEEVDKSIGGLNDAEYKIINIDKKESKRNPLPPFTTSTLQQAAWQRFRFPAKLTMGIAQKLYETGRITYHRTDSFNLSESSLASAQEFIVNRYGKEYHSGYPRRYKTNKRAQEAHEAIRPTNPNSAPEFLDKDIFPGSNEDKLYEFIWRRFIASQMTQAIFDATTIDIGANKFIFRVNGQILKFDGFLRVYPMKFQETEFPSVTTGEILQLVKLSPSQHFTQPPPRYNEATLIKALEENGIGRPSTYAPILSTIQERNYIEKNDDRRFQPTEIGLAVNNILVKHFPEIVDIKFTAKMEESLDKIADNQTEWVPVIKAFYEPFETNLKHKYEEVKKANVAEEAKGKICPECAAPILIRLGRFGRFYACSRFPKCKHTESLQQNDLKIKCPKCLASQDLAKPDENGKVVEKRTKKRKIFYGCSNWPKCDFASWDKPTGQSCPTCGSPLVIKKGGQIKCSNKECDYKIAIE
ncbi:MAG: DNA topoisomerase I [Candidatus Wildermuthbacteria bacterium RIFCSPLOWO2_12_FULL_40_9]|uniref:DNA topoisomerase 1 n=1 Tax=Candidatus Wildermuthbacteria bacterium RIFCSPLOWO2_12_FULL_40_9 TaxID=1802467 RepID=A0A1G2RTM0_9BACT|nr:MAG: DNA topoisomerase I [Candidatus Wildermuthbacteria bacterium RIFCSPLOWO2_12_FULL_40_9]